MSYEIGRKILNLEPTSRVGRTEYCYCYPSLIEHITGLDSLKPELYHEAMNKFYEFVGFDFAWYSDDGPRWEGRWTDMGHAEFQEGGTDLSRNVHCPFTDPDEVLEFDASKEYGLPDISERTKFFQTAWDEYRSHFPDVVIPGGYYKTIVSGAIQIFGWEMLLMAAGIDQKTFGEDVLEGIFKVTQANINAWAETNIEYFISHDDMVWTQGAIFKPEFYREYIFPRYKELWKPLKDKGIKVIFISDANYTEFVDDIADAGADGFMLEPMTSLEYIAEKYGKTHVIVGNADTRILTWGTKDQIKTEVERCMKAGRDCPGFIMAVGNHIPANVPKENALYYFDLVKELGNR